MVGGLTVVLGIILIPFLFRYLPYPEDFKRDRHKIFRYTLSVLLVLAVELTVNRIWGVGFNFGLVLLAAPFFALYYGVKKMKRGDNQDLFGGCLLQIVFLMLFAGLFSGFERYNTIPSFVNNIMTVIWLLLWPGLAYNSYRLARPIKKGNTTENR